MEKSKVDLFCTINIENKTASNNSYDFIESLLDSVELDGETATKLFESQFNPVAAFVMNTRDKQEMVHVVQILNDDTLLKNLSAYFTLYIGIENFEHTYLTTKDNNINNNNNNNNSNNNNSDGDKKESLESNSNSNLSSILWRLGKLCDIKYLTSSTFSKIDCMIEKILNSRINDCTIVGFVHISENKAVSNLATHKQVAFIAEFVSLLLQKMMQNILTNDDLRLTNTKHININSLMQAIIMIAARYQGVIPFSHLHYRNVASFLTQKENEQLVSLMCQFSDKYFPSVIGSVLPIDLVFGLTVL